MRYWLGFLALVGGVLLFSGSASAEGSGGRIVNDFNASLASSGGHLWLARYGKNKKDEYETEVLEKTGHGWKRLSGHLPPTSDALLMTTYRDGRKTIPCLGLSKFREKNNYEPAVFCRVRGRWKSLPMSTEMRQMGLVDLEGRGGRLVALFTDVGAKRSEARIGVSKGGRFAFQGRPTAAPGSSLFKLGTNAKSVSSDVIDVAVDVTFGKSGGKRWVATLDGRKWRKTRLLPATAVGPQIGGPVRTSEGLFFPVTEAYWPRAEDPRGDRPWEFSVFQLRGKKWSRVGGHPLNQGKGKAQGHITVIGDRVVAVWDEIMLPPPTQYAAVPTREYIARLNGKTFKVKKVWSGKRALPTDAQAVGYKGKTAVLFMRQDLSKVPDIVMHSVVHIIP